MKTLLAAIFGIVVGYAGASLLPASEMQDLMMPAGEHAGHTMEPTALPADATEATKKFAAANDAMHKDMAIAFTGNADKDFVAGMIPHHQGAIDMAKIVLEHGTDAEIKALATGIITAQEAEIAQMKAILGRLGQ